LTRLLAIYLVLFMLFQTGFIYTLTQAGGYKANALDNQLDVPEFNHQELVGATWLVNNSGTQDIFGGVSQIVVLSGLAPGRALYLSDLSPFLQNTSAGSFYIFLGTYNIEHNEAQVLYHLVVTNFYYYYYPLTPLVSNQSLIYSNGGAEVYS